MENKEQNGNSQSFPPVNYFIGKGLNTSLKDADWLSG